MIEAFGTMPDGTQVERIQIMGGGLKASVLTYGAVIQDLRLEGHNAPLVLGFPEFPPYLTRSPYFGAMAGRCANRIRNGHLALDGNTYQLDQNFIEKHLLHGGANGVGKQCWTIEEFTEDRVCLGIRLADGHMGFPGNLTAFVTYAVLGSGTLDIRITAKTDAPTLCNFAHHSYFNLDGGDTISDHLLTIDAEHYLPVDEELIPTGDIRPVTGTPFDFRTAARIGQSHPLDHNFCLSTSRENLRKVARLESTKSGVAMDCLTTEPGLQVYDGTNIDIPVPGLAGKPMGRYAGAALEPQIWPDANHHLDFPSAVLRPGETYEQHTQYVFSRTPQ